MSIDRKAFLGTTGLGVLTARLFGLTESETEDPEPAAVEPSFVRQRFHESELDERFSLGCGQYSAKVEWPSSEPVSYGSMVRVSVESGWGRRPGTYCEGVWFVHAIEYSYVGGVAYTEVELLAQEVRVTNRPSYRVAQLTGTLAINFA